MPKAATLAALEVKLAGGGRVILSIEREMSVTLSGLVTGDLTGTSRDGHTLELDLRHALVFRLDFA